MPNACINFICRLKNMLIFLKEKGICLVSMLKSARHSKISNIIQHVCLCMFVAFCGLRRSVQTSQPVVWEKSNITLPHTHAYCIHTQTGSTTTLQAESRPFDSQWMCMCWSHYSFYTRYFLQTMTWWADPLTQRSMYTFYKDCVCPRAPV